MSLRPGTFLLPCLAALVLVLPAGSAPPAPVKKPAPSLSRPEPTFLLPSEEEFRMFALVQFGQSIRETRGALYTARALLRQAQGDAAGALLDVRRAEKQVGRLAPLVLYRAALCGEVADWPAALRAANEALALETRLPQPWAVRAGAHYQLKQPAKAEEDALRAIELGSRNALAWNIRGLARWERGDLEGAAADFTRAADLDAQGVEALRALGQVELDRRDLKAALAVFTRALERQPDDVFSLRARDRLRARLGDKAGGLADVERIIAGGAPEAEDYARRGELRLQGGDLAGAEADLRQAISLRPNDLMALCWMGDLLSRRGEYEAALALHEQATGYYPKSSNAFSYRAATRRRQGNYDAEVADFDRALENDASWGRGYALRADALHRLGRWDEAARDYREARRLAPRTPDYDSVMLWVVLTSGGKSEEAGAQLRDALGNSRLADEDGWLSQIATFLLGQSSEPALLASAEKVTDEKRRADRLCEAWYFAGVLRETREQSAPRAREAYQAALVTGRRENVEFELATAALKRLPPGR